MNYYINKETFTIKTGPFSLDSADAKRSYLDATGTHCGNLESLPSEHLVEVGIVPDYYPPLGPYQRHNSDMYIYSDRVEFGVEDIPMSEILDVVKLNLTNAVQEYLDATARTRNYDGILSLCTYATSSNIQFKIEGQAGVNWRDNVWTYCYQVMTDVQLGLRPLPTKDELISELPVIDW